MFVCILPDYHTLVTMFSLRMIVFIFAVVPLNYKVCLSSVCTNAEYKINSKCCSMCAPGSHVNLHCTEDTYTSCVPCPASTYIDKPNGLNKCFPCAVCAVGQGLKVKKACTRSSDIVCEPLEGFFCIDQNKGSCTLAVKHSKCNPGQYIKQTGTDSTDTVCADCTGETYSNGSFSSCLPHTRCEALGLTEIQTGIHSSDAECGNPPADSTVITISVIGAVLFLAIIIISLFTLKWMQKKQKKQFMGSVVGVNAEPINLRPGDKIQIVKIRNNLEMRTVPYPLTNDFAQTSQNEPEIQRLKQKTIKHNLKITSIL